jgi:hypothetical protein
MAAKRFWWRSPIDLTNLLNATGVHAMLVFTIFGSVNDTDTFFCEALANVSLNLCDNPVAV